MGKPPCADSTAAHAGPALGGGRLGGSLLRTSGAGAQSFTENWKRQKPKKDGLLTNGCRFREGTTIVVPDDPQHGGILRPQGVLEDRPIVLVNSVESLQ